MIDRGLTRKDDGRGLRRRVGRRAKREEGRENSQGRTARKEQKKLGLQVAMEKTDGKGKENGKRGRARRKAIEIVEKCGAAVEQ